jgi:cytochrome oxidase assembly protein ShyY1
VLALLRTKRWLGFSLLVVFAIIGFGLLSRWQWSRAEEKRQDAAALAAETAATTVPLGDLLTAAAPVRPGDWVPSLEWRTVSVTGRYAQDDQVLVRRRPMDGRNGFWVLAPLVTADDAVVWVNRGWLPAEGAATAAVDIPAAPAGVVTVTGRLRPSVPEPSPAPTDLPAGQVSDPDVTALTTTGAATVPAYLELITSDPPDTAATLLPLPQIDESRNVSYAIQWLLFAAIAVIGWWYFLRREARDDAERAAA